jgi:predicted metal-dependent phosphoesterase TrpH
MRESMGTADLHMHTNYSDGRPTVRALLDYVASRATLRVVAITDHDTIEGALEAQALQQHYPFEIIVGEEVSSLEGHVLALFITKRVPPRLSAAETIAAIHEQGGLAIAAHPFITTVAIGCQQVTMQGVGKRLRSLPFDAVEIDNSTPFMGLANLRAQRFNRQHCHLPEVGNSDAHILEAIGKSFTRFPGRTMADLRQALLAGRTTANRVSYSPRELLAYGRFWLDSTRPAGQPSATLE